jgi:autotransporter translocation and assembly factor TamB
VSITLAADSLPLADVATLAGNATPVAGRAAFNWRVLGSRDEPTMRFDARVDSARVGDVRVERVTTDGRYADLRLDATVRVYEAGRTAFTAARRSRSTSSSCRWSAGASTTRRSPWRCARTR